MSKREQNLLNLLLMALVIAGALLAYRKVYEPRLAKAKSQLANAEQKLQIAEATSKHKDLFIEEQEWLTNYQPEPVSQQSAQSKLQEYCSTVAKRNNLEIKSESLLPAYTPEGTFYHRAKIDLLVVGKEKSFYNWLTALDNPQIFQRITFLSLYPNKADDTLIEAKVVIEKWYIPASS